MLGHEVVRRPTDNPSLAPLIASNSIVRSDTSNPALHATPLDHSSPVGGGQTHTVAQDVDQLHPVDVNEHPQMSNARRIFTSLAAGAMAGALAKTVIAPLDRTKIYFQTHPDKNYRILGAAKFLRLTYEREGFWRLWRGNSATMARIVPYASIQFMAHEQYKRILGIAEAKPVREPGIRNFAAGSMAGLTGQSLTYPLDRARAVMAVTKVGDYSNLVRLFQKIIRDEGVWALYIGFVPTMAGVIVYAGTSFFVYEKMKHVFMERQSGDTPKPTQRLLAGALAGLVGQTSSYPLDMVRRRMQTARQMGVDRLTYATTYSTLKYILKREGFRRGLYKGISMNFIKGPIATAISFTTFDYFQLFLRRSLLASTWELENNP